jgi:AraC-like DNA-binding protein
MADRLSALLQRFDLRARVHSGATARAVSGFDEDTRDGSRLHLLRRGRLVVTGPRSRRQVLAEPGVVLLPRPAPHRLEATESAELVSAEVEFGVGDENPLLRALPPCLVVPLARLPGLEHTHELLFGEALRQRCGHGAVVNRLAEVLLIQVLRYAIEQRMVDGGLMAGLADPRLHKALAALHADPARAWTLEMMAAEAGMSRARFAAQFAQRVGVTPGEYLIGWRLGLARSLLRRGLPVKQVALEVGYANASALGRVFSQRVGRAPAAWRQRDRAHPA